MHTGFHLQQRQPSGKTPEKKHVVQQRDKEQPLVNQTRPPCAAELLQRGEENRRNRRPCLCKIQRRIRNRVRPERKYSFNVRTIVAIRNASSQTSTPVMVFKLNLATNVVQLSLFFKLVKRIYQRKPRRLSHSA